MLALGFTEVSCFLFKLHDLQSMRDACVPVGVSFASIPDADQMQGMDT